MTKEDAKDYIREWCPYDRCEEIIKALQQDPCEDMISRQAVMNCFKKWQPYMATRLGEFEKELLALPPVAPELKSGHWVDITNKNGTVIAVRCSCCGQSPKHAIRSDFCPRCGSYNKAEGIKG